MGIGLGTRLTTRALRFCNGLLRASLDFRAFSHGAMRHKRTQTDKLGSALPQFSASEDFLTKEDVRLLLNLVSTRGVDELVRRRAIPCIRLGHKTVRFSRRAVIAAVERLTVNAI